MSDHEIRVVDKREVEQRMEFTGSALTEEEITRTNTLENAVRQFKCSCGETGIDYQEALSHMQQQNSKVTPETFREVARDLKNGETIPVGERENGFILSGRYPDNDIAKTPMVGGVVVGIEQEDRYIVALMKQSTETRGRNEPRLKTRRATYSSAKFYEVNLDGVSREPEAIGRACIEHGGTLGTGYVNGHLVTPIADTLDEIFKYYSN